MNQTSEILCRLLKRIFTKKLGQGVIEYGGALIVASLVVVAVLVIDRAGMTNVYYSIFNSVENYFKTQSGNI